MSELMSQMSAPCARATTAGAPNRPTVSGSGPSSALLFLYRRVIGREVGELTDLVRARKSRRLPVVLTRDEVKAVLSQSTATRG